MLRVRFQFIPSSFLFFLLFFWQRTMACDLMQNALNRIRNTIHLIFVYTGNTEWSFSKSVRLITDTQPTIRYYALQQQQHCSQWIFFFSSVVVCLRFICPTGRASAHSVSDAGRRKTFEQKQNKQYA